MADFFHYLINASICSAVFYLFYYCFLHKIKLFAANRIYLLSSLLASLVIPLLDLHLALSPEAAHQQVMEVFTLRNYVPDDFSYTQIPYKHLSIIEILQFVYLGGVVFMLTRLSLFIFKIARLIRANPTTKMDTVRFVLLDKDPMLFSFFHFIFIDKKKIRETASSQSMIEHEKVHVRELHSLDLIIAELVSVLLWFNPFVFFYCNSIKENHEYLADSKVIEAGVHPVDYLTILAKEVFSNHLTGLTSNFNYSITKKRLLMITKINTSKKAGFRFLFVLPLLAIVLLAFAKPTGTKTKLLTVTMLSNSEDQTSNIPSIPPIKEKDIISTMGFGWHIHPIYKIKKFHEGMDLKASEGTPVYATASGTIELVKENKDSAGNYVYEGMYIVIRHSAQFQTRYTHLSGFAVKQRDQVSLGQVIGYVGSTGMSTGPHLHYEVIKDGKPVDPKNYISKNK